VDDPSASNKIGAFHHRCRVANIELASGQWVGNEMGTGRGKFGDGRTEHAATARHEDGDSAQYFLPDATLPDL
jgi:hypothetical protein